MRQRQFNAIDNNSKLMFTCIGKIEYHCKMKNETEAYSTTKYYITPFAQK